MPSSSNPSHQSTPAAASRTLIERLFEPVDAGLLVFFRIAFGLLMAWEASRYLTSRFHAGDWIERLYLRPEVLFKYYGFEWVAPWPGDGMYYHFWGLGILGLLIAAGCFYRVAMALFFVGFTYIFLQDQAAYLNHFYLISLISFLMIFLPLNRASRWIVGFGPRSGKPPHRRGRFGCYGFKSASLIPTAASPNSTAIGWAANPCEAGSPNAGDKRPRNLWCCFSPGAGCCLTC